MFRINQYCSRYEETPIQLDTPIIAPADNVRQNKSGYQFTINDRSSYFDWFNGYFEVKFVVNQLDGGGGYAGDNVNNTATMINCSTSLINNLNIKQNGKVVYEGNDLFLTNHVKSLVEYSGDYATSISTGEFFYVDTTNTPSKDNNFGFNERINTTINNKEVSCIIPLNRYSFFNSLQDKMLPPSQIQVSTTLTNDNVLIYKHSTAEAGRVVISKFVLWIPRMIFNTSGMSYVMNNYMKPTSWTYLREMVQSLNNIRHADNSFRISPSILNPKFVFVFFQRSNKMNNQDENPYIFDTFKLNAADDNCHLQSARLSVGNGIYYPEIEYSYDNIVRIFKDVNNYTYKQNDKNTGSLLNLTNFKNLYGMLFFNIAYKNETDNITNDPKEIILNYKLSAASKADYTIYSIVLYEQTVKLDVLGNELILYT